MIRLEQVVALEARVEKAVALISSLRTENSSLRAGLAAAESRVTELETLVAEFQKDQSRIEEGILQALRKLDSFEDSVHGAIAASAPQHGQGGHSPDMSADVATRDMNESVAPIASAEPEEVDTSAEPEKPAAQAGTAAEDMPEPDEPADVEPLKNPGSDGLDLF